MAVIRLSNELTKFKYDAPDNIFAEPVNGNILHLHAAIEGPRNGLFEGGIFHLDIIYPYDYPFSPPKCIMLTKMFHPNISSNGQICMNILEHGWCPALTIRTILLSISSILDTPNMEEPINLDAARCFQEDREKYNLIVRQYTLMYAIKSSTRRDNLVSKL